MKGFTTLKDVERAMRALWREDPEYARTLLGPRTRGSTTERALFELGHDGWPTLQVRDREIAYVGEGQRGAAIYTAQIPELGGRLGAVPLADLGDDQLERVRVRRGPHALELYVEGVDTSTLPPTDLVTFVVGQDYTLWTWHPGLPLNPLDGEVAVKLT